MLLTAIIHNNFVVKSTKYDNGKLIWEYKLEKLFGLYSYRIREIFYKDNYNFINLIYKINNGVKVLYNKTIINYDNRVVESYYDNGVLASRQRYKHNIYHSFNKPTRQYWYMNGLRKSEYYYTNGLLNNSINPAISKWYNNGILKSYKYYSHGCKIHRNIMLNRIILNENKGKNEKLY